MLTPPAHSTPSLPRWVVAGGFLLAAIAGCINVSGLLGLHHAGFTHMTGTGSQVGIALAGGETQAAFYWAGLLAAFLFGAALSGLLIASGTLQWGRPYGLALGLEALLLAIAIPLLHRGHNGGDYLIAGASGLQNALATTFGGAILRTTHISGLLTDLGVELGHWLRRKPVRAASVLLWSSLLAGFLGGGYLGALAWSRWQMDTLYLPATALAIMALVATLVRPPGATPKA
ncbi:MAG: YoaK family protein [Planctomycetota bacterium]